ncbi:MAG: ATP-binding cassette domain-containing protein, partial [Alphaproteobacteria bacterium]|nr:ATP-binding cassette domain-containing protein [Alphaproteobacteria bacterium]
MTTLLDHTTTPFTAERANYPSEPSVKFRVQDLNVFYGNKQALSDISFDVRSQEIMALIGPSGCGKTTLLRCFNRMNDLIPSCQIHG